MEIPDQMLLRKKYTLGADPEIFVFNGLKLLPAYEFLPDKDDGKSIYWDGFQAEWKLDYEGRHCQNNMVKYMREALMNLLAHAKAKFPNARLSAVNTVRIPDVLLKKAHPRHVALGCEPSFNAYRLKGLQVDDPRKLLHRCAGGHMHFGEWLRPPQYERLAKGLDRTLGVFSVGAARNIDNPLRRKQYGMPGEFRTPKYGEKFGFEYRVLSNFWITAPAIQQLIWEIGRLGIQLATSKHAKLWAASEDEVKEAILNCDTKLAERIISRNKPMLMWMLQQRGFSNKAIKKASDVFSGGIEDVVPDVNNFPKNWHFDDEWLMDAGQPWAQWRTFSEGLK